MFAFYPEEPEYYYIPSSYYPRSQFSGCRQHNQPPCSYHSNPYSSYSHPCSDSFLTPTHNNNRSYHRNYNQGAYHNRNTNRRDRSEDDSIFLNNHRQRDSLFTPDSFFNVQPNYVDLERMSRGPQGRKFHNGEELKKKTTPSRKSRSIPVTTPSDSVKANNSKTTLDKNLASRKIYKFLRYDTANHKTRKVLSKLLQLRNIQNQLTNLIPSNGQLILTFSTDQKTPQVLPISKDNKKYLEYEDTVLKILSKLDEIDSNGYDIVRERRREIVGLAQGILNRLDEEKERQWKEFKAVTIEGEDNNNTNFEKNTKVEGDDLNDNNTVTEEEESMAVDDVSEEKVGTPIIVSEVDVTDAENNTTQPSSIIALEDLEDANIKPYSISQENDVKETVLADEAQNDITKEEGVAEINSSDSINTKESMDVDDPSIEDTKDESPSFVDQEKSSKRTDDEFVVIESEDLNKA
ncbi:15226_t:CDS:1 [Acaulospora morrowiae]|uniref:15226_t:CDS:1 n=1 Tax=Acaulospora morrowiae TaxID=94023 RepID=A0A9N9EE48_9GLOM|nr:15226_t:CDS:1 [Acaulospora morrowiae]